MFYRDVWPGGFLPDGPKEGNVFTNKTGAQGSPRLAEC